GFAGNTIMAGHNNLFGAVFGGLTELQVGDEIAVWSEYGVFSYRVQQTLLLEEEGQPLEVRLQTAQWLNDTPDDRLTLITCWPRESYTHRLIMVGTRRCIPSAPPPSNRVTTPHFWSGGAPR